MKFVGTAIMVLAGLWGIVAIFRERRERRKLLRHRPRLDLQEIYREFYANTGLSQQAVAKAWRDVAGILRVAPEQLRPHDRIDHLRSRRFQLQSDIDDLVTYWSSFHPESRDFTLETIDEVVRSIAACDESSKRDSAGR